MHSNLDLYLNDHLAGSIGALEMLDHLMEIYKGSEFIRFLSELAEEIRADQRTLQSLMRHLALKESEVRKAGAWIGEKFSRIKLHLGTDEDGIGLMQAIELLSIGILGKKALWTALASASERMTELRVLDYAELEDRARRQFERVEAKRLTLALQVLPS